MKKLLITIGTLTAIILGAFVLVSAHNPNGKEQFYPLYEQCQHYMNERGVYEPYVKDREEQRNYRYDKRSGSRFHNPYYDDWGWHHRHMWEREVPEENKSE